MIHQLCTLKFLRKSKGVSERGLSQKSSLSRLTLRQIESLKSNITLKSLSTYAQSLGLQVGIYSSLHEADPGVSSVAVCLKVERDGFESWKTHFMDLVDEFRKTLDMRLVLLAPPKTTPKKLKALLASIVLDICNEVESPSPTWAQKNYALTEPWFLSESESLKAMAIVESPAFYKKNNIFVLENFLKRA